MKTVSICSLGCRVNQYEEQALKEMFVIRGYSVVPAGCACDVCVINTCAVTAESERKSRNLIARAKKTAGKVIVTGCYAELLAKRSETPEGVFYVGGCKQKKMIPLIADGTVASYSHDNGYEEYGICTYPTLPDERFRAYVKIEDGCNGNCSYCIIPLLRGKSSSRPADHILGEVGRLADAGVSEIILTGIETSDYSYITLGELINRVSEIDGIKRIRLGSLNPNAVTDEFLSSVSANKKFCRHLHLSLQSGCGRILNLMRRPYSIEKAERVLGAIIDYIPDALLSADIISGFPTETDAEADETLRFIERHRFMHIHAFPYSPRPYTDAALMKPQVPVSVRKARNDAVISLSSSLKANIMREHIGKTAQILTERNENGYAIGHTDDFLEMRVPSTARPGDYITAYATDVSDMLIGKEQ